MQAKTSSFTTPRFASPEVPSPEASPYVEQPPANVMSDLLETFNPALLTSCASSSYDSAEIAELNAELEEEARGGDRDATVRHTPERLGIW
ncbi:hypothetical protein BFJ68_g17361 [Fusarium oxysporum]|uniref:Uncharacterized protein n=1 Tax=Fusarium oxysporum TaxID=5507 RepID=A0A420NW27_FUSOX|nr:hypothetical protein BFJ68_g17361 [Fusarium oxysporum]